MSDVAISGMSPNQEPIKPSRLMIATKWLFWITIILYVVHIAISYYLDWRYPIRSVGTSSGRLSYYMESLGTIRNSIGYFTIGMLVVSAISIFRTDRIRPKLAFGVRIIIVIFTIFGYQGVSLIANRCDICGRPFWSRGFFFKRRKEAKLIKTNSWIIIKE